MDMPSISIWMAIDKKLFIEFSLNIELFLFYKIDHFRLIHDKQMEKCPFC